MVSSVFDPLRVPDEFWACDEVGRALGCRDVGELFRLLRKHLGASQTRIGTAPCSSRLVRTVSWA
jgi:hypothetical protein